MTSIRNTSIPSTRKPSASAASPKLEMISMDHTRPGPSLRLPDSSKAGPNGGIAKVGAYLFILKQSIIGATTD
jgi:hypothetical protein